MFFFGGDAAPSKRRVIESRHQIFMFYKSFKMFASFLLDNKFLARLVLKGSSIFVTHQETSEL